MDRIAQNRNGMNTYTLGFDFKPTMPVTKADIVKLCKRLQEVFGPGWEFRPEAVTEGGIQVTHWPGKVGSMYKTIRFRYKCPDISTWSWPCVPTDCMEKWKDAKDVVWYPLSPRPRMQWCYTWLKAFHHAPPWTRPELHLVANVLAEFGILTRKMPRDVPMRVRGL